MFFQYRFLRLAMAQGMRAISIWDELSAVVLGANHRLNLFMPVRASVTETDWKREPVPRSPAKTALDTGETANPSVFSNEEQTEDPLDHLMEEALSLKNQIRELLGNLSAQVKGVRRAKKERSEKERDHRALSALCARCNGWRCNTPGQRGGLETRPLFFLAIG